VIVLRHAAVLAFASAVGWMLRPTAPLAAAPSEAANAARVAKPVARIVQSCFLLHEVGVGEVRREPHQGCDVRVAPMSTFKIPHALAGLDAGVLDGPDALIPYDGRTVNYSSWAHDQTLRSAMRNSVLWYFQRLAERLGPARERQYLEALDYGNHDPSSGLTSFWLNGSLKISPDEQLRFLLRLYGNQLHVSARAVTVVRDILIQPAGVVTNASGEHPFAAPWPPGVVVSAKTGAGDFQDGSRVRWIIGHVQRSERSWVFVSCISGSGDIGPLAAIDLAAGGIRAARVW
jgi:beta-lactamase class D